MSFGREVQIYLYYHINATVERAPSPSRPLGGGTAVTALAAPATSPCASRRKREERDAAVAPLTLPHRRRRTMPAKGGEGKWRRGGRDGTVAGAGLGREAEMGEGRARRRKRRRWRGGVGRRRRGRGGRRWGEEEGVGGRVVAWGGDGGGGRVRDRVFINLELI